MFSIGIPPCLAISRVQNWSVGRPARCGVPLAFGEALERLRVQLGTPIYLTSAFELMILALQEVRDGGAIAFNPIDMVGQGTAGNAGVMVAAVEGVVDGDMRDP